MASRSASWARRSVAVMCVGGVREALRFVVRQCARPEAEAADQRAVHQQVGVAADRTGEMRIARQGEAEMADVVGAVLGLRLAAQHHVIDQRGFVGAGDRRSTRSRSRGCT